MLALAVSLLSICLLQDPAPSPPPARKPPSAAPVLPALQRAIDGALAASRNLLATDHAFTGNVAMHAGPTVGMDPVAETVSYRGAAQGAVHLFAIGKHTILTAGRKRLERVADGTWTLPQGDAPDCPLSPTVLAMHLPAATIDGWSASSHGDRPALRVHAVWKDKAAAALVGELSMPDAKADRMLESLAAMVKKPGAEQITVDASVFYDPATRSLQGVTLRIALMQPDAPKETDDPAPCPAELPPLSKGLWFQIVFECTVQPAAKVPMPALDAAMRECLGLPAK
jgi:hypothetical protein